MVEPSGRRRPSCHIEIVESCTRQHYTLTAERDCLGFEQAPLAGSLCERTIGANDPVPWRLARIGKAQYIARQARRARRNIAVGADEAWGDRPHPAQNRGAAVSACVSCHPTNGATVSEPAEKVASYLPQQVMTASGTAIDGTNISAWLVRRTVSPIFLCSAL